MSESGPKRRATAEGAFAPRAMLFLVIAGVVAFAAMLVLGAYAPDLRNSRNGGSHALSNAATGFAGIVTLANATGRNAVIVRNERQLQTEDLAVLAPESGAINLSSVLATRRGKATLLILPKWLIKPDPDNPGWVYRVGLRADQDPENVLAPAYRLDVQRHRRSRGAPLRTVPDWAPTELRFTSPAALQTISGTNLKPLVTDRAGRAVVAQLGGTQLYLLADPDLLANHGLGDRRQAAAALALLDYLNSTGAESVLFDVTLNGLGQSPSPLRLAFDPPFLAVTLALTAALLLAALQARTRFGPARRPERAIAFGKAALIGNAAALVRKAGRERALGERYAQMIRDQARVAFAVPAQLRDSEIDAYLDRLERRRRFSELAGVAGNVWNRNDMLAAAQALHGWQREHRA